jgi:hypothetical protein
MTDPDGSSAQPDRMPPDPRPTEPMPPGPMPPEPTGKEPLRSRPTAGSVVGGILAGLEAVVTGRPVPPAQIEESYRDPWASLDGVTVEGLDDDTERPEPPDRSGARL